MKIILEKRVSYQENVRSPITREENIGDVLQNIKNCKYQNRIVELRKYLQEEEIEKYNENKKRLPAVTFCATFSKESRVLENLKVYNDLIVIDIDKLDECDMGRVRNILIADKYVFSFWTSPSNKGIKGLVAIKYIDVKENVPISIKHKTAFKNLEKYFWDSYFIQLDKSGSDIARLCFYSIDPQLYLKSEVIHFDVSIADTIEIKEARENKLREPWMVKGSRNRLYNPENRNNSENRNRIQAIIKYLTKRKISITDDYDKWYRVAYAISSSFTFDIGEKYYLKLCRLDCDQHDEIGSRNMLIYCYENNRNEITFGTIIKYAQEWGYKNL